MDVRLPDGTIIRNVPDGTTKADLVSKLQRNGMTVPSEWLDTKKSAAPTPPASVDAGSQLNQIPRQLGLTARYGLEGLGQAAELITEPLRQTITDPLSRKLGLIKGSTKPMGQAASGLADALGLPSPQGANERVIADASRMVAGAGGVVGAASKVAQLPGMVGKVGAFMAQNPTNQLVSAAGAGGAAGASREAGGSPAMQAVAGVVGGLAAPAVLSGVRQGANAIGNAVAKTAAPQMVEKRVENQINLTLQRAGVDWKSVEESVKAQVRRDVADALNSGRDLSADALARLVEFRRVGATPTAGALSLDPVQITREKNLAKIGANSSDPTLQQLSRIENANNNAFIANLNDAGAAKAADPYATSEQVIGALTGYADRQKQGIGRLYDAARDSSGRSANLDGHAFTSLANKLLDEKMLGYAVPDSVARRLNQIANGEVPFTVEFAEQMKTVLGDIARADRGGATAKAMSVIRQAIDDTPIRAQNVNPGNLPAIPGTVPPSMAGAGQEAIDAFNRARSANRQFMGQVDRTPALAAALDGAAPDNFLNKFVIGKGANVRDVDSLISILRGDRINPQNLPATAEQIAKLPAGDGRQALEATKNAIADYLKKRALGGAADEVGNFSQSEYNKALREIGDRKLSLFFSADEIQQLKSVGRVASYTQFQPRGSAVNNSNSGALLGGLGLDFLSKYASRAPFGLNDTITGVINGTQARQAMRPANALIAPKPATPIGDLIGPELLVGNWLLAPQLAPNR